MKTTAHRSDCDAHTVWVLQLWPSITPAIIRVNREAAWTEILSRIRPASPGIFAGGVYGYRATTETHGLFFREIVVVVGPVVDRLAGRASRIDYPRLEGQPCC